MKLFEYKPLRTKLKLVIMSTSVLVIVLVFAGFFTYEHVTFKRILLKETSTKTDIIVRNSNKALTIRDSLEASRILNSLAPQLHINSVVIFDNNNAVFASYSHKPQENLLHIKLPSSYNTQFKDDAIVVYKPITLNNRQIGTIYMSTDLADQQQRFWSYIKIAFLVLIISLTVAYIAATFLAKNISEPIISLADTAQLVYQKGDYSIRADKLSNDETGFLADSFNQMLFHIQEQDAELKKINRAIKNTEKRYRSTLDHMLEGCQIIGYDWHYLYLNQVAIKQSRAKKENILGKSMMHVYPGIENTDLFKYIRRCMLDRIPHDMENKFVYPDGEKKWFTLNIEPVPEGVFILSEDITEQRTLKKELKNHQEHLEDIVRERTTQLETANKEMESFAYSVSHDLRAPLRAISGYTKMLEEECGDNINDEGNRLIRVIQNSAKTMGSLIDDLLALSRLGRKEIRKSPVDMTQLTQTALHEINKFTDHKAEVKINELLEVTADGSLINQVMVNLLSNAIKYSSKKDRPIVEVKSEKKNGHLIYSVTDNGAGFDMQYVGKLFGVFQRLHSSFDFDGTGVGLAIVNLIIRRHNGSVWAEGKENEGATFYFSLPAKEVNEPQVTKNKV